MEHPGDADEAAGFIVELLIAPQGLQNGDAHGGKQAVGPHDDQEHRHEIQYNRVHAGPGCHGNIVAGSQGENA